MCGEGKILRGAPARARISATIRRVLPTSADLGASDTYKSWANGLTGVCSVDMPIFAEAHAVSVYEECQSWLQAKHTPKALKEYTSATTRRDPPTIKYTPERRTLCRVFAAAKK